MRRHARTSPGALILIALGVAAALWGAASPLGPTTFYFLLGGLFLVFAGVALVLQQRRDARDMAQDGHVHEASDLSELLLHRVSIALPARRRDDLGEAGETDPVHAHGLLSVVASHLEGCAGFTHVIEPAELEAEPERTLALAAEVLSAREHGEVTEGYRASARTTLATRDDGGLIVYSVLVLAHPTAATRRPARTLAEARELADAIVPVAPEHTRGVRVVITPGSDGLSFTPERLSVVFPELSLLGEAEGPELGAPLDDEAPARLPPPALRFDLSPESLATRIEEALARFEDEHAVSIDRGAIHALIAWAAPRIGAPGREGASVRRGLLRRVETTVNQALARMQAPRRLTRIVFQEGEEVHDARFALVTAAERERLRASGAAVFAPWPREILVGLARLPLGAAAGWLTWSAMAYPDAASGLAAAVGWVSFLLAEGWVRRRRGTVRS